MQNGPVTAIMHAAQFPDERKSQEVFLMQRIRIGMPLAPGVFGYEEGAHYNYTAGGHTLKIARNNPSHSEIDAVQHGRTSFALTSREEAIFILVRFGQLPWEITHYNWWINSPVMRPDPYFDLERLSGGIYTNVCLIDASNGLVAALRSVRLSREFTDVFLQMVQSQMIPPFDPWRYLEVVEQTFKQLPNPSDLLREAVCFCGEELPGWQPFKTAEPHTIN
jgi:hypothetical protein